MNYIEGRQFGEIINAIEQKIANLAQWQMYKWFMHK